MVVIAVVVIVVVVIVVVMMLALFVSMRQLSRVDNHGTTDRYERL